MSLMLSAASRNVPQAFLRARPARLLWLALPLLALPGESSVGLPDDLPNSWPDESDSENPERSGRPAVTMGGQAVMDGIIMRNGGVYALAMRLPDGGIVAERRPWYTLARGAVARLPFVRGFPVLVETLVNGIQALNRSAELSTQSEHERLTSAQLGLTLLMALAMAAALFVAAPHLLSLGMNRLGLGGGMEGLSFHVWDGCFKFAVFLAYIGIISLMPDIRKVFQYHGAEHKVIGAYEAGGEVSAESAVAFSRLHPRCGTTFLLFVLLAAIALHAVLVPPFLRVWRPESAWARHAGVLVFKLLLMAPISAVAYEGIRAAARVKLPLLGSALRAPGLLLQRLTTREPDAAQLEVAVVALREALAPSPVSSVLSAVPLEERGPAWADSIRTPAYTVLE